MKIKLGSIVKDKVTGMVGVAENRASFLYGCDRYCVQPRVKDDGTIPKSRMVDEPQLELVEGESSVMTAMPEPKQLIELGQIVHDPVRGLTGTATGRAIYLNGCARVCVEPKQDAKKEIDSWWTDEPQLTPKTTFGGDAKKTISTEPAQRKTGGPARSCSQY